MPRTQVKGSLICDNSVTTGKLADDAVTTAKILDSNVTEQKLADGSVSTPKIADDAVSTSKIIDRNVTEPKLADDIVARLLTSATAVARERFPGELAADTDMTIPGGFSWASTVDFLDRFVIILNGQVMGNGAGPPVGYADWVDVYPGSSNDKIRFAFPLKKGHKIQVIRL
jgi:hypothetical protein